MRYFSFLFVVLLSWQAGAWSIYNLDYYWPEELQSYFTQVNQRQASVRPETIQKCSGFYSKPLQKEVLDIRYSLGYFDDSRGTSITHDGKDWGLSPSLDIAVFNIIRSFMKRPCLPGSEQRVCGFTEEGDAASGQVVLKKDILLLGKNTKVVFTLTHASASEFYNNNKTTLASRQSELVAQSEKNYFEAISAGEADVVIYNGHSRNGGGPDFNPPVLNSSRKTDYKGYYEPRRIGIKRLLQSIQASPNKDQFMALFSCYSQRHFHRDLMKANPKQRMILSSDTIDYKDSLVASLGYVEALLQGNCGQELSDVAKQGAKVKGGFQAFNIQ